MKMRLGLRQRVEDRSRVDGPPSEGVGDVLAELRVLLDACGVLRDNVAACERVTGHLGSVWWVSAEQNVGMSELTSAAGCGWMRLKRSVVIAWAMLGLTSFPDLFVGTRWACVSRRLSGHVMLGVGCVTWLQGGHDNAGRCGGGTALCPQSCGAVARMYSVLRRSLCWAFGGRISEPYVVPRECFGGAVLDAGGGDGVRR